MKYARIEKHDIANGDGVRVSIWVSGCRFHCNGCFNQELWDFDYGTEYTEKTLEEIITALDKPYISGLTILGGEPLAEENRAAVTALMWWVKFLFKDKKDIWLYTGYKYENIQGLEAIQMADVIVDDQFVEQLKDISLQFRGSRNQRIIRRKEITQNEKSN